MKEKHNKGIVIINLIYIIKCAEMNNNETVVVQLEKGSPEYLKCNRSSEKYEIQWRKVEKREQFR